MCFVLVIRMICFLELMGVDKIFFIVEFLYDYFGLFLEMFE